MNNELKNIKEKIISSPLLKGAFGNGIEKYAVSIISEIAKTANDEKKNLTVCTKSSIITAIKQAYDLNLEIDARQHCHLIRFNKKITEIVIEDGKKIKKDRWIPEAQLQIGYRGYIYSIKKHYPDANIDCKLVYEGDNLTITKEGDVTNYKLEIANPFAKKNKIIGGYCYISYALNGRLVSFCETLSIEEIYKIKNKAKTDSMWNEWFEEKAKVAIIKRACKIHFSGINQIAKITEYDNQEFDLNLKEAKSKTAELESLNFANGESLIGKQEGLTEEDIRDIEEIENQEMEELTNDN
jgi:recombinational DNA repair protein RecT